MPSEKEIEAATEAIKGIIPLQPKIWVDNTGTHCKPQPLEEVVAIAYEIAKVALEAAEAVGWLGISEAPRDGTHLLITDGKQIGIGWFGVDWYIDSKGEWLKGDGDDFSTGYYFTPCEPTHFQYLPTPPTQTEGL